MQATTIELLLVAGLLLLLGLAFAIGRRIGRRHPDEHPQLGVVQGATLGLMGLILGFSFSGAMTRFAAREDLIVKQANALSTAYLRTDLITQQGPALRDALKQYASLLPGAFDNPSTTSFTARQDQLTDLEATIWSHATTAARQEPAFAVPLLTPLNELFDTRTARIAATQRHLPTLILIALVACATISVGTIGYGMAGGSKSLLPPAIALVLLMVAILWIVIDLDHPRHGLIRISDAPLESVIRSLR
ncbi:MAG TPA: hypothetical protein VK157_05885 [Phycisphaerales bacterium]|nr:hypothetical protein [Phycisphaerales bacterium]